MNFELDESLEWDVTVRKDHANQPADPTAPTPDELFDILKNPRTGYSISSDDSEEFKALRNQLEELGYIRCERGWWNGDTVLKEFTLNGVLFEVDTKFPSGSAMKHHLPFQRKYL
jgi:hypothetical protein